MKTADSITAEFQQGKQLIAVYAEAHDYPVHYDPKGLVTFGLEEPIPYWQALDIAARWTAGMEKLYAAVLEYGAGDDSEDFSNDSE
jgi:hypothetical protein